MYNLTTNANRHLPPDKKSIKAMLDSIGKKAKANDIFLIFFAGHGAMAGPAGKQQFYFLTSDAASLTKTALYKDVGISSTELSEWMKPQKIKAQKRILVFDACSSGQAIADFSRTGMISQPAATAANRQRAEQVKAIDKLNEKSGFFILSASASGKDAYEIPKFSQGLLTYSLLKTIKVNPEILEDNQYLNIGRWFNVAEKTVSDLIKENNLEQEPQIVAHNNFSVGVVDEEVMTKINIPVDKPLFTGTGLINGDPAVAFDDLELGNIVNLQLNNISARGSGGKVSFLPVSKSPDALSIRGQYTVSGEAVNVIVNIIQNKKPVTQFKVTGDKNKLEELAVEIAMKCSEWAITNK
jgi:sulfur carrier protein ThiS